MAQINAAAAVDHGEGLRVRETSSRCVTEGATHDFVVTNYLLLDGMGIGKCITSSTFSAGGYDWTIKFYPDGERADAAGNASAFLRCLCQLAKYEVRTKFTLTMLDDQGDVQETREVGSHVFSPESAGYGFHKFVEKSKLRSSSHLLTVRCVVNVIKEPPAECRTSLAAVPPAELLGQLERTLKDGIGADVTILVGGRQFRAHRFMLAMRLPLLDAQIIGLTMEVVDMEPDTFEILLHYVYTDSLPPSGDGQGYSAAALQHLLAAADRYGLDRLKAMCQGELCEHIEANTVMTTLALAEQYSCERLKDACLEFMSSEEAMLAVIGTDRFQHLMKSYPMLDLEKSPEEKVPVARK